MEFSKAHTKDEKFMLILYKETDAMAAEEDEEAVFDRYDIGAKAGLTQKGTDTVCNLLLQANFIKKTSKTLVYITPHGRSLVQHLQE